MHNGEHIKFVLGVHQEDGDVGFAQNVLVIEGLQPHAVVGKGAFIRLQSADVCAAYADCCEAIRVQPELAYHSSARFSGRMCKPLYCVSQVGTLSTEELKKVRFWPPSVLLAQSLFSCLP